MAYTRLNPSLNGLVTTRQLTTATQTIAASNGGQQGSIAVPAVSGYTFVGVIGTECSAWELPLSKSFSTASNWFWAVSNAKGWAGTYTVHALLLYVRSDAL